MGDKLSAANAALPRVFCAGNFKEWLQRFEVCAKVNKWDTNKSERLATFLDGEALVIYLELPATDQADYETVIKALTDAFHPDREHFAVMEAFKARRILPNETPRMYLHELKKMLQSSAVADKDAQEALLFHQFVCGLPESVSWQIRADTTAKTSEDALKKAQLLMQQNLATVPAAAVQPQPSSSSEVKELRDTVQSLQESVSSLSSQLQQLSACGVRTGSGARPPQHRQKSDIICFYCHKAGHIAKECYSKRQQSGNARGWGMRARNPGQQ